ncbi:MAG: chloride channel protein [Atopobiaceae bacterium]|nr:chloride channel protein [Atopobiaceae bacterium]MCI2172734.1 chloride channel protein [Atopobiaceae bacterium]MCI2207041.1 chloride channel protein [Atopobiaceae bacterium]
MAAERTDRDEAADKDDGARRLVRDAARGPLGAGDWARLTVGMVAVSLVAGLVVGLVVRLVLWAADLATSLVWDRLAGVVACPLFPLVACTAGGVLIGLWVRHVGGVPDSLEEVLAKVKETGGYHVSSLPRSLVSFALPLAFGGAVGPEAGASGLIAAGVTWAGESMRKAGLKAVRLTEVTMPAVFSAVFGTPLFGIAALMEDADTADFERFTFGRWGKVVLYTLASVGGLAGFMLVTKLVGGGGGGLPHLDAVGAGLLDGLVWFPLPLAVGYLLAQVSRAFATIARRAADVLGDRPVLKATVCGLLLGAVALALPDVLFSGEEATGTIAGTWVTTGAATLILTGVVKLACTQTCISFGWMGGSFFPMIFSGVSVGYGLAALTGADPMLMVAVTCAATVAGVTRKPVLAVSILVLCFPLADLPWLAVAAFVAGKVPALVGREPKDPGVVGDAVGKANGV